MIQTIEDLLPARQVGDYRWAKQGLWFIRVWETRQQSAWRSPGRTFRTDRSWRRGESGQPSVMGFYQIM